MSRILVMNIATNRYVEFLDNLYSGIRKNFLKNHSVQFLLFTDNQDLSYPNDTKICYIEHKPFPESTLKRYNYFMREKDYIESFDYVFYSDVDMSFISPIGDDILGDLCLTKHILSYQTRNNSEWTYERNPKSKAYVPLGEGENYYAGGFNGGSAKEFIKMSETISKNVSIDESNGIVAKWHDESHLNRYAIDNPPSNILELQYCCPDWRTVLDFDEIKPKILALNKNHQELRS